MIVYALLFNNALTTVSTSERVISVGTSPLKPPVALINEAVAFCYFIDLFLGGTGSSTRSLHLINAVQTVASSFEVFSLSRSG